MSPGKYWCKNVPLECTDRKRKPRKQLYKPHSNNNNEKINRRNVEAELNLTNKYCHKAETLNWYKIKLKTKSIHGEQTQNIAMNHKFDVPTVKIWTLVENIDAKK